MMEVVGWSSSILFAICGTPQAYYCWKRGRADGMSNAFLITWFMGELLGTIYAVHVGNLPILVNYSFNLAATSVMLRYKYFPTNHKQEV